MTRSNITQFALGVIGFAIMLPATAAANPAQTVKITHSDLDLENKKDVRMLGRRIARAIEQVCGSYAAVHEVSESEKIDDCRSAARQQVAPQMARLLERKMRLASVTPALEPK